MVNAATEGDAQAVSDCLQHLQGPDIDCTEQYNVSFSVSDCLQHLQGPDIDCTEQYNVSFYHDYFEIKSQ